MKVNKNYRLLPELTPDGLIYWNKRMGTIEAMLPPGQSSTAHAPALLELPDGTMLCAWFAGSYEGSADISIVCARLEPGADHWSEPLQISHDPYRSEQNPSLFLAPSGEIWAMYTSQLDRVAGKDNMQYTSVVKRQRSLDGGFSWEEAEILFPKEGTFCRQPIQILSNGRWIFSNWICTDSPSGLAGDPTVFQISDDQGMTWKEIEMPHSNGKVHANIVELESGHLIAFMRSRAADFIYQSQSDDWGESWTEPVPTVLPNNNSSISAIGLKSGRVAIAYNPTHAPSQNTGKAVWPGLRCPVAVALSEDGGSTWPMIRYMELGEGYVGVENSTNNLQYEYPCLLQGKDGMLNIAFAYQTRRGIKWMRFSEKAIMGEKRETSSIYNPTAAQVE